MIKFLVFVGILYGVGTLGVGINQTVASWDSQDVPTLIQSSLLDGLVWPATFIEWLA